jgi:hypothetical protein
MRLPWNCDRKERRGRSTGVRKSARHRASPGRWRGCTATVSGNPVAADRSGKIDPPEVSIFALERLLLSPGATWTRPPTPQECMW